MRLGMIGLGKMGLNMARRLLRGGHEVVGYNITHEKIKEAEADGATGAYSIEELADKLSAPRIIWMMLPAGEAVDETIEKLKGLLAKGDVIVDGGNSLYRDDLRRAAALEGAGIGYMDAGVSGGVWGLEAGYCLMVGGPEWVFELVEPALAVLAPPDGYHWCGPTGAGHYVKMVHNGIEYGMMQAYAEGFELMRASRYGEGLDMAAIANLWNQGSVVRSWLLELLADALRKDRGLASIRGYVEDSGEGRWTVNEAVDLGVNLPVITASLFTRFRSRSSGPFAEKVLAALRNEFGGHAVKKETVGDE